MKQQHIHIKGARVNNLKNIDVKIPHRKMIVITGLSGSGKSSLAFDTLYAEGQRRYVESLSSYARQFLGRLDKPEVDFIKGISPAIAIEQKVISNNPRSTVGTTTEVYDYLKILFARAGKTYSPISGNEVRKHTVSDVVDYILTQEKDSKLYILSPILNFEKYGVERQLKLLKDQGYIRLFINQEVVDIDEANEKTKDIHTAQLLIDRIRVTDFEEDEKHRISDSVHLAFTEGNGVCLIHLLESDKTIEFNNRFELDGMDFTEPSEHFFTFNNPVGACKTCEGFGNVIGIDENLVIPDPSLSVYDDGIACWKGESMSEYKKELIFNASKFDFPIHRPIQDLTPEQYDLLWKGNKYFTGINGFFEYLESKMYKIQYRVMLSRYRGKTLCPDCRGTRLRKDASYVKINDKSIIDIILMQIDDALQFFKNIKLDQSQEIIKKRLLPEITNRLQFISDVGLGYLTLNRASNSLSGGESQRINLATSLGSSLVGSMYILDEPSIGLHPRDTERLITVLKRLRDIGNTVIIVEHEESVIRAADEIIDIGPKAGIYGGEVVFQGDHKKLLTAKNSLTADYLTGKKTIEVPKRKRKSSSYIQIIGARENNLKNIDVKFPLHSFICVTGVSGSGKSTLIHDILYPALSQKMGVFGNFTGKFKELKGDWKQIDAIEFIDQNPIGKSSRSNPVTYVKAFDDIRTMFTKTPRAKALGLKPGYFSFNVDGGRCEMCEGEGTITVGMQFMADVHLKCETCHGKRYKSEALDILLKDKNIADILEMDIQEGIEFFSQFKGDRDAEKVIEKIQPLADVGLGYLKMGQSSSTLSGGEAQRVKLASFLIQSKSKTKTLFIFDEPTTGLHFYDIDKLLIAFQRLVDNGHSLIVIEHNLDVIKCADWVIDLGPEGGNDGGSIIFEGTPEDLVKCKDSYTGKFLKEITN